MRPTLLPGNEILVNPFAYQSTAPQIGDVVWLQHPLKAELKILKRVTAVTPQNQYFIEGDNPDESTDSRHFGTVPLRLINGRVTSHFA